MKPCPEGCYTSGHLWMAVLAGAIAMLVVVTVMLDRGLLRTRPDRDGER